jgi:hypothetical protein
MAETMALVNSSEHNESNYFATIMGHLKYREGHFMPV